MRLTAALFALALALIGINADIVVFSESDCGGGGGLSNDPCDDISCNQYNPVDNAIESFRVLVPGPRCVSLYGDSDCNVRLGLIVDPDGNGGCTDVDIAVSAGSTVVSFRCSSDGNCVL